MEGWREVAAKAAIVAILFQVFAAGFCHLPAPRIGGAEAAPIAATADAFKLSGLICTASGARSAMDTAALTELPTLFHRVPPPEHQDSWSCPVCFALFVAAVAILTAFFLPPPLQIRAPLTAQGRAGFRAGFILLPHPTRGPPLAAL